MKVLDTPTLILNKHWQAIRIEPLRKCFKKALAGRAMFVDEETYNVYAWDKWFDMFSIPVNEATDGYGYNWVDVSLWKIRIPEITIVTHYGKVPHVNVKLTRRNLLVRDGFKCQYTGEKVTSRSMTIDHVIPKSRGGKTEWTNVVVASQAANMRKANRLPHEAGMKLLTVPEKPHWHPLFAYAMNKIPKSWEKFIHTDKWNELGYWDVELVD